MARTGKLTRPGQRQGRLRAQPAAVRAAQGGHQPRRGGRGHGRGRRHHRPDHVRLSAAVLRPVRDRRHGRTRCLRRRLPHPRAALRRAPGGAEDAHRARRGRPVRGQAGRWFRHPGRRPGPADRLPQHRLRPARPAPARARAGPASDPAHPTDPDEESEPPDDHRRLHRRELADRGRHAAVRQHRFPRRPDPRRRTGGVGQAPAPGAAGTASPRSTRPTPGSGSATSARSGSPTSRAC